MNGKKQGRNSRFNNCVKETFREIMLERGITASYISKHTGVPSNVLSDWLTGKNGPRTTGSLLEVCRFLGVTIEQFCYGIGELEQEINLGDITVKRVSEFFGVSRETALRILNGEIRTTRNEAYIEDSHFADQTR